jgi:uncharacterized RDD family membrane protein YckC
MSIAVPTEAPVAVHARGWEPAGSDRRFYAFVLDRLLLWSLYAAASAAAYLWFLRDERWLPGIALIAGVVVLLALASATVLGAWGVSAGKAALGLRVLSVVDGRPIGLLPAVLRAVVVGLATLPTFGFGAAALAWTAVADSSGRRRGWHDLRAGSLVVDVRPSGEPEEVEPEEPRPVVNLTAMRLVPPSPTPPSRPPAPPNPHAPDSPTTVSPRLGLGWPLVGAAPDRLASGDLAPTTPPPPAGRRIRRVARWRVTFDTGEVLDVEGLVLVGRRPEARTGEPVQTLLALVSEDMSLSKTHAQFQVVPDGALVVMDRGSTNGSVLVRGGLLRTLEGGKPATLKRGDRVRFGDREMTVSHLGDEPRQ